MTPEQTLSDTHKPRAQAEEPLVAIDRDTSAAARLANGWGGSHLALAPMSSEQAGSAVLRLSPANGHTAKALREPSLWTGKVTPPRPKVAAGVPPARTI